MTGCDTIPSLAALRTPPPHALSLRLSTLSIDAPKRKQPATADPKRHGHHGLGADSGEPLSRVVLSRLVQVKDDGILATAMATPIGAAFMTAIKAATMRVAIAAGGADPSFNQLSINTLYNQSTSTIGRERIYNGASLSLPGKLSWTNAKALMQALLDAVTHVRLSPGRAVELSALIMKMPPPPLDTPAQTLVNAIVGIITTETTERLDRVGTGSGGGGSSSNAAASTASTSSVSPQPVPIPVLAAEPFALNSALSLRDNVMRLLQSSMHRSLDQTETDTLDGHLLQALSVLQAGGEQARRDLLSTGVLQALSSTGGAYLWAAALEASENGLQSVDEYGEAVVSTTSEVSTALFATALGV